MLYWVTAHKDKPDIETRILSPFPPPQTITSTHILSTTASPSRDSYVPPSETPPIASPYDQFTKHIFDGDGNCFISAVCYCMHSLDPTWTHNHISLRTLSMTSLKKRLYDQPELSSHHLLHPSNDFPLSPLTIHPIFFVLNIRIQDNT
jgi:hypothetical protein